MTQLTLIEEAITSVPNPATGETTLVIDTDHTPKLKTSTGAVVTLQGPQGLQGTSASATPLSDVAPQSVATTSDKGVATTASRSDHIHAHGAQGGGSQHTAATTANAGFMSATDKLRSDNLFLYQVNISDFGADLSGATASDTALTNAIGSGGKVVLIPGGMLLLNSAPYVVSQNNVEIRGAGSNSTTIKTNATTGDQLRFTGYGCTIRRCSVQGPGSGTTSSKTSGIGIDMQSTEGMIDECNLAYQATCIAINGALVDVHDLVCRYFTVSGIVVMQNSDHRISVVTMDNNAATLPTGSGIDVQLTASLILDRCNIIHSNYALNISPAAGVTVPSIKATNCFFDTSVIGLRMAGAGAVFRSEFTNCWFSSMTQAGVYIAPTTAGANVDGLTFVNCSIYNNIAGTTYGVQFATGNYGTVDFINSRIAGWTAGVNIGAGSTTAFPTIRDCHIGGQSAFANNGTGIIVATSTYAGLIIDGNKVPSTGNTTPLTLGTVTVAVWSQFRITDNPTINPRGAVTTPAVPASTGVATNTTGFRVLVMMKAGTTAPTVLSVNGVSTVLPVASQVMPITLEPGGTIAATYTVAFTWTWVGQ